MNAVATPASAWVTPLPAGRALRIGLSRIRYEVLGYFRQTDTVFFTFLFPVLMLTIFSTAFSSQSFGPPGDEVTAAAYYLPAMLAAGILLSGVQNLGVDIAVERSDGTLKRLGGTPLPVTSYFIGKIGQVFVTAVLQSALIIAVSAIAFQVPLPTDASAWLTFAWVFLLGVATSAVLGIAISALPRSGKSATAVIIPIALVLQFISGVYLSFTMLPEWLQSVAGVFPLRWMASGMRAAFLPASFEAAEPGGSWGLATGALVLAAWLVVGLVACRLTFRWIRKDG
ncbi:ABC transporter permease [Microbacterium sp.]|uniref:ABC transporter permease n=1 Tax=Microbacterium sp. TaxID=51671 RepID=UPI003C77675D